MNDGYGNGNGNNLAEEEVADKGEEDAKRDGELLDRHLRQQDTNTPCMRPSSVGRGQAGLPVHTWKQHVLGMCVGVGAGVSATPTCKHCACPCQGVCVRRPSSSFIDQAHKPGERCSDTKLGSGAPFV